MHNYPDGGSPLVDKGLTLRAIATSLTRLTTRLGLPQGSLAVGAGLAVAGVSTYAFLALAARALGPSRYGALSGMWGIVFLLAPALYGPFEQEVGRALAARRVHGMGGLSLLTRTAAMLAMLVAVVLIATAVFSGLLLDRLFDHQLSLLIGFGLAMVGFALANLVKGGLAGIGRFSRYGSVLAAEGVARLVAGVAVAALGAEMAGPYGMVVGLSPFVVLLFLRGERELFEPGPPVQWSELTANLGYLFTGATFASLLVYAGPVAAKALATPAESDDAGRFLATLVVARVPLFLFQAIQVALLPKLSRLAAAGLHREFRSGLNRILGAVVLLGGTTTLGAATVGPFVIGMIFGQDFVLGRFDVAVLGLSTTAYMIALTLAQGLIAYGWHRRAAVGWFLGFLVMALLLVPEAELLMRVERALALGSAAAAAAMAVLTINLRPAGTRAEAVSPAPEPFLMEP